MVYQTDTWCIMTVYMPGTLDEEKELITYNALKTVENYILLRKSRFQ